MLGQQAQPQVPPLEVRFRRLEINYRWAVGIAVIAIVALGVVLLWTGFGGATTPRGEQVVSQMTGAWSNHDVAAIEGIYADDAVLITAAGAKYEGLEAITSVSLAVFQAGFKAEAIGPVVQSGDTIAVPMKLSFGDGSVTYVTSIFELNPAGKIVRHQDYGQPMT